MSIHRPSSSNRAFADGTADLTELESSIFEAAVERALNDPEITAATAGPKTKRVDLRNSLHAVRKELIARADAERQRWIRATVLGRMSRGFTSEEQVSETTGLAYLARVSRLLLILAISVGIVGLVCGYPIALFRHSLVPWRHAALIGWMVALPLFIVMLVSDRVNERRILQVRERLAAEAAARSEYEAALADLALGEIRKWINQSYRSYDCRLRITRAPGLAEVYSDEYRVESGAARHLADLLEQMPGGTIGLAGPRGAGKTTLIRMYCPEDVRDNRRSRNIAFYVSAPVEYAPQEFILHLLATLCRAYLQHAGASEDSSPAPMPRIPEPSRLRLIGPPTLAAGDVAHATSNGSSSIPRGAYIIQARRHLKQLRYLQTYTTTLGANVSLPTKIAGASGQSAAAAAELPRPYPELVSEFCTFLRMAAHEAREHGGHVIIGIDELDKISDAEQAQRFINELKAVLGVPNCYYLIAVSENALVAYEMRGLPLRDAFDSAFDEIIQLGYQTLDGSRDLLSKRVIGMSEPFVCLCHCLAGGLPRDLIRAARHVITESRRPEPHSDHLSTICQRLIADELSRKLHATGISWARSQPRKPESDLLYAIQQITERQPSRNVLVKGLHSLLNNLSETGPNTLSEHDLSSFTKLACYLYYLSTLIEIFTQELTRAQMVAADTGHRESIGAFDCLCFARQTLAIDPRRAWLTLDAFRRSWDLIPLPYPGADACGSILLTRLSPSVL